MLTRLAPVAAQLPAGGRPLLDEEPVPNRAPVEPFSWPLSFPFSAELREAPLPALGIGGTKGARPANTRLSLYLFNFFGFVPGAYRRRPP